MRIATFNLENFDDEAGQDPSLATRVAIMGPQLQRIDADVLCLQEVHSQDSPQGRTLAALDTLLAGTGSEDYQRLTTTTTGGDLYQERNLVTLAGSHWSSTRGPSSGTAAAPAPPTRSPPLTSRPDRRPPGGGGRDEAL